MNNFVDKIELVKSVMFERFPNCQHTIIINLWDDGDYIVTAQHGDEEGNIHRFSYYTQDPTVRYVSDPFISNAVKMDKCGNNYYVPNELIRFLSDDTKETLNLKSEKLCNCKKNHTYGFVEGQEYTFEQREHSIGVLNVSQKTWYNFHRQNSPDYFLSTDFDHYFEIKDKE